MPEWSACGLGRSPLSLDEHLRHAFRGVPKGAVCPLEWVPCQVRAPHRRGAFRYHRGPSERGQPLSLTQQEVRGIADYARIALTDEELVEMTAYMNDAVENVLAPIRAYDLAGVEPVFHPIGGLSNVMRDDAPRPGLPLETALENAGQTEGRYFRVPAILGNGGEA